MPLGLPALGIEWLDPANAAGSPLSTPVPAADLTLRPPGTAPPIALITRHR
ncbi:MAG: hypothetical protein R3F11_03850 [Verrucomicrobiales bacterium]